MLEANGYRCYSKGMKELFLVKLRLTYYYPALFIIFLILILAVPSVELGGGQLTLLTVNSFLLAFYLAPILASQKQRIDDLAKAVRLESIALFNVAIHSQELSDATKHKIKSLVSDYLKVVSKNHKPVSGEQQYETLLRFAIDYKGKDEAPVKKILETLVKNEENRTQIAMQLRSGVFSHEWFVLGVLTIVALAYIVVIDYHGILLLNIVAALLCTGITLLLIILAKLTTLTHKKAKIIWQPYKRLLATDFKHIDQ